ncbi:MAG: sulfocyanin-like copper-binding protein [Actinomycetota bacterium]|nr:sulfocyanin-like copper-binding protein [Actinomycetota bacterium]
MRTTEDAQRLRRHRLGVALGALALAGATAGIALSANGSPSSPRSAAAASYDYYRLVLNTSGPGSMMRRSDGFGSPGWMMGSAGYSWMMGGASAPGWMRGQSLPRWMMSGDTDPGSVMGKLFADAPGVRVNSTVAAKLGDEVPAGATADRAANRLVFTSKTVGLVVLASPSMPKEDFRIAGMTNPAVVVPVGSQVRIELINADSDMAHGLVVSAGGATAWMPMMSAPPAFSGAALWFLGAATSAGMHAGTFSFTASAPGSYRYFCPVPGHADDGMVGRFVVSPAS